MKAVFVPIQKMFRWFFEACFPPKCLKCGREGKYLCQKHNFFFPVPKNLSPLKNIPHVFAAVAYDSTAEKMVDYFKFRGVAEIANILADEIVKKSSKDFFKNAVLIPIPLHWTRKFWRGFNQAEVLAKAIADRVPNVKICKKLKRIKRTSQQARLKKNEREKNVINAFSWNSEKSPPDKIIIVDDVAATGSTLDAAALVLKKAGAKEISAVVFARGKVIN